jgi:serine/threonine protein kinase
MLLGVLHAGLTVAIVAEFDRKGITIWPNSPIRITPCRGVSGVMRTGGGGLMALPAAQLDEVDDPGFGDELKPETRLLHGQFTIESFLNAGGFGITYVARDSLNRQVVVKECFPAAYCRRTNTLVAPRTRQRAEEFRSAVKLFLQEAFTLAGLDHPNIVKVHQVFEDNDTAYIAMEYIRGPDLLETVEGQAAPLQPGQIKTLLTQVLDALGYVHAQGVLHRDISPDNILLELATGRPVLIDFGAARKDVTRKSRALSGLRVVKDGYSPQEFYITGSTQTPSSDLYALAASFSHLVTGEAPKSSQERLSSIANRQGDPQVPLLGRVEGYPSAFLAALDKAMAIFPRDRLASVADWQAMLVGPLPASDAPIAPPEPQMAVAVPATLSLPPLAPTPDRKRGLRDFLQSAAASLQLVRVAAKARAFLPRGLTATKHGISGPGPALRQPFLFDPADPGVVVARLPWSPDWVVPGLQIVEINGTPVQLGCDMQALMTGGADLSRVGALRVIFGYVAAGSNDVLRKAEIVPVVDRLTLAPGLVIDSVAAATGTQLVLVSRPGPGQGDLCPGDTLLSYAPTGERLCAMTELQHILTRETARNLATFSFAIQRHGGMASGSFSLSGEG